MVECISLSLIMQDRLGSSVRNFPVMKFGMIINSCFSSDLKLL